jgi:hypothetical protein
MRCVFFCLLIVHSLSMYGQDVELNQTLVIDEVFNTVIVPLAEDEHVRALEAKWNVHLNTLASCFVVFTLTPLSIEENQTLSIRIRNFSTHFYKKGAPVYLSLGGSRSWENCKAFNDKGNEYNLTCVSTGNFCVVNNKEAEFESIFNKQTLQLLGIRDFNAVLSENH